MNWSFKDYLRLAFFAFCLAFFFLLLRSFIFGEVGRYQLLAKHRVILDTSTGAIYASDGTFMSKPNKWDAFWGIKF